MTKQPFTVRARIRSLIYALRGIWTMLRSQHNAWLHGLATGGVVAFGIYAGLGRQEWCWIVLAIVTVWIAEALNTAFEFLADVASPDYHPLVRRAKDVSAGAVLISVIGAIVIGVLILGPHLMRRLEPFF
ncbi:MAG: diacylglycerol kinase family protein [Planctomycetes bacterium]|nr:diacylglycerol kinase family protein [Planctomycetota bacterium]